MELKFIAVVNLSESEIRGLIEAEVRRRYKDVKPVGIKYNFTPAGYAGNYLLGGNVVGGYVAQEQSHYFSGASVNVEKS